MGCLILIILFVEWLLQENGLFGVQQKRAHTHTHIFTKCGAIILSNLLSRQILQIFVFGVVYNVCISYTYICGMCAIVCVGGWWCLLYNYQRIVTHLSQKYTRTYAHTFYVSSSNKLMLYMYVAYLVRFVSFRLNSIRILRSLWNVWIEWICCVRSPSK